MDKDEAWDYLTETVGVSEETLQVVTAINGYTVDTLKDVLYAVAAERAFPDDAEDYAEI